MSRKSTGRRNTLALNARLDCELDADLIAWLGEQPAGRKSEAIRDLLRDGLRMRQFKEELRDLVRQALQEALAQARVVTVGQGEVEHYSSDVEASFGEQLDQLLDRF